MTRVFAVHVTDKRWSGRLGSNRRHPAWEIFSPYSWDRQNVAKEAAGKGFIGTMPVSAVSCKLMLMDSTAETHCESPKNCNAEEGASRSPVVLPSIRG